MTLANELKRFIPSIQSLLSTPAITEAGQSCPRWALLQECRVIVDEIREENRPFVQEKALRSQWLQKLAIIIVERAQKSASYSLTRVINATGVVLHTNMGRALLAPAAIAHMVSVAQSYSNLELDLQTGERGSRYDHVSQLLCQLTGAQDALVVNNNAAAVILCLRELAQGKEVVISRGELVEIGGSFRIPEIMETSGCLLKEVGATNRTHLQDYENAIGEETALLLKVHTSNYKIIGFKKTVEVPELRALADAKKLPIMNDLGAGCLVDLRKFGLPHEPTVQEALEEGADIVTFSGDKLLGGPQIGIIAGRSDIIAKLKKNQLLRAFRVDKLTLAALEATLRIYKDAKDPSVEIPCLAMLAANVQSIEKRANSLAKILQENLDSKTKIRQYMGKSQVGGGSSPESGLDTCLIAITPKDKEVAQIDALLRQSQPPIMIRVHDGEVLIDLRTVSQAEEAPLQEALLRVLSS